MENKIFANLKAEFANKIITSNKSLGQMVRINTMSTQGLMDLPMIRLGAPEHLAGLELFLLWLQSVNVD